MLEDRGFDLARQNHFLQIDMIVGWGIDRGVSQQIN
jgi:hypothetical protein